VFREKSLVVIAALSLGLVSGVAHADVNFDCTTRALVQYSPGAHWDQLEKNIPQHLGFIAGQLKSGTAQVGGPIVSQTGEPQGGLVIYNTSDTAKALATSAQDPLVTNGVATITAKAWDMCVLK